MPKTEDQTGLPFAPRDWVASKGSQDRIARVKAVYRDDERVMLDLVIYDRDGTRIGRESPAMGGPSGFEPWCCSDDWDRIEAPVFPVELKWVPQANGKSAAQYVAGKVLPPANYKPRPRRRPAVIPIPADDPLRRALEAIANGHNDPRTLAKEALGMV